jgi:protein RecA
VEITNVEEIVDAEGEVMYVAHAHCDCYKVGIYKPKPFPEERSDKTKDGLAYLEVPVIGENGEPEFTRGGKQKVTRVCAFEERLKSYEENSYEEFRVGVFDAERSFDPVWYEKIGVDTRRLIVQQPESGEEVVDSYDGLLRSGVVDLLICDSIAAMTPRKEIQKSAEDDLVAVQARMMSRMCRKTTAAMCSVFKDYHREVTQIWVNQLRVDVGVSFGTNEVLPAGKAQKFAASVELRMWSKKGEELTNDHGMGKADEMTMASTIVISFRTEKNKTAPPRQTGSFTLNVLTGKVDQVEQIRSIAERYGLVCREGAKWICGLETFRTRTELDAYLMENYESRYRDLLLAKMLGK